MRVMNLVREIQTESQYEKKIPARDTEKDETGHCSLASKSQSVLLCEIFSSHMLSGSLCKQARNQKVCTPFRFQQVTFEIHNN